jgi:hypothetical protein
MGDSPRVALCLFGQMRTYEQCYSYLEESILDPLDPDIFIHTWENRGGTWKKAEDTTEEKVRKSDLDKLYSPVDASIEEFHEEYYYEMEGVEVPQKVQDIHSFQKGMIPMFYKMKSCNSLKNKHEKKAGIEYDVVILTRPDLAILQSIPNHVIDHTNILWHDYKNTNHYKIGDQLTISSSQNMDYFTSIFDQLEVYWNTELQGNYGELGVPAGYDIEANKHIGIPERLLHFHIKKSNIETASHNVRSYLLRHNDDGPHYPNVINQMYEFTDLVERSAKVIENKGLTGYTRAVWNKIKT